MAGGETVEEQQALALAAAEEFANEDVRHCERIGRHGAKLIRNGMNVLTHCNAGWLAFVDVGSRHRADVCRAGAGQKIPCLLRRNPAPLPGRDAHRLGTGATKNLAPDHRRQRRRPSDATRRNRPGHRRQRPHARAAPAKWPTRSAPTRKPCWPGATAFRFTSRFRCRRLIGT